MLAHPALRFILCATGAATVLHAQQITHPEALAGRWEAPDGHGGSVGMNILIDTTVPRATAITTTTPQTLADFEVAVYQRTRADVPPLGFNVFTVSSGGAIWDGHHLRIDVPQSEGVPAIYVLLTWRPRADEWTGTFERGNVRADILTRPTHIPRSVWSGTWLEAEGGVNLCLHIAQAADGSFTAWSGALQLPGRVIYPRGYSLPPTLPEFYGATATAHLDTLKRMNVVLHAYTPFCCSHLFSATLAPGGNTLQGVWPAGPNQTPAAAVWTRVPGDSCLPALSRPQRREPVCPALK